MKAGIFVLVLSMACTAQAAAQDRASPHATDLTARAAVDAALQGAAIARLAVSERYTKTHAWVHDRAELGFQPPSGVPGRVDIDDGVITVVFDAPEALAGKTLRLLPSDTGDGMVHWRCEARELPVDLKPKGCE